MLIADRQQAKDKSEALSPHLLFMSVFLGVPDTICSRRLLKKRWQDLSLVQYMAQFGLEIGNC